jgi:hypothetical protein
MTQRGRIVEEITAEKREQRWQKLYGWHQALHDAYYGDRTKLSAYLRRPDLGDLDQGKREQLADLIDRRLKDGKPSGRIPPADPHAIPAEDVAALARALVNKMRRSNGGRTPRGGVLKAIATAFQLLADDYRVSQINRDEVRAIMFKHAKP